MWMAQTKALTHFGWGHQGVDEGSPGGMCGPGGRVSEGKPSLVRTRCDHGLRHRPRGGGFNRFAHSAGPYSLVGGWLGCLFCPSRLSCVFCLCWVGCCSAVLLCCCLAGLLFCCLVGLLSCRLARKTKTKTWGEKKSKDNKKTPPNWKKRQKSTQNGVRGG